MSATAEKAPNESGLHRYFRINERGSSVSAEVRGGVATFFTMAYIVVLNPLILTSVPDSTGQYLAGGDIAIIAATTALVAGLLTILMGVVANYPLGLAAGLGLNAVVTFGIAGLPGMTWADATGLVVLEGLVILILVLTGFREAVFRAVPAQLKVAISVAAAAGGMASVSSNTSYIESATGVGEGARTGLASVVTGALFLVATFFSPLVTMVPYEAATPALIVVGYLMMRQVRDISWDDLEIAFPAFLTIVLMPFTYSITAGIGAGFIGFVFLKLVRGRASAVHPLMWLIAVLFLIYFTLEPIRELLGA